MNNNLCPQCGAPVAPNADKCEYCGAAIAPAAQPAQAAPQPQVVYVQQQPAVNMNLPAKSKIAAAVLAFLLGGIGVHKFYLGQAGMGILYLLFSWTGIPSIAAFIDAIILLCSTDENFQRKYRCRIG